MKIVYIADDGVMFDNQYDCEKYEFDKFIKTINIKVYDDKRHRLQNIHTEDTHNKSYRVIIANEKDLTDMKRIQNWTGFYCYIDSIGTWIYDGNEFVKKEND